MDGEIFYNNLKDGKLILKISEQVEGLREALLMMPEGSSWEIVIPAKLAYGERGKGRLISPHMVLVFNVELVKIL